MSLQKFYRHLAGQNEVLAFDPFCTQATFVRGGRQWIWCCDNIFGFYFGTILLLHVSQFNVSTSVVSSGRNMSIISIVDKNRSLSIVVDTN